MEMRAAAPRQLFRRVSKRLALEAAAEGTYASAARGLADRKKETVIREAEKRLAGTGWVPAILRRVKPAQAEAEIEAAA